MFERIALYAGLRSTYLELSHMINGRILNIHDNFGGFQRGLIVLQTLDGEFNAAFSSSGYFLVHDGEVGDTIFKRERGWSRKESGRRLRRGNVLEFQVELDGHANVELDKSRVKFFPYTRVDRIPVEEYLMDNGAFQNLKRAQNATYERLQMKKDEIYNPFIEEILS